MGRTFTDTFNLTFRTFKTLDLLSAFLCCFKYSCIRRCFRRQRDPCDLSDCRVYIPHGECNKTSTNTRTHERRQQTRSLTNAHVDSRELDYTRTQKNTGDILARTTVQDKPQEHGNSKPPLRLLRTDTDTASNLYIHKDRHCNIYILTKSDTINTRD